MNRLGPLKAVQGRVIMTRKAVAKRFSVHENRSPRPCEPTNHEVEETERNSFHTAPVTEARIEEAQRNAARDEEPQLQARVEEAQRNAARDEDPQRQARIEKAQDHADELIDAGQR